MKKRSNYIFSIGQFTKGAIRYVLIFSLFMVAGCNSIENEGVDQERAKTSPLIIPPCAN